MSETQATQAIAVNEAASLIETKEMKFRFNKDKLGNKRATVELKSVPVPSYHGIVKILEDGGKGLELLKEVVADTIREAVATFVGDNENIDESKIDWSKFSWIAIATAPRQERKTIAPEIWEAFAKDYQEVMPGATGKSPEAIANAITVYLKKFSLVKTNKQVLGKLKEQLGIYMEHSKNAENFSEILELLISKADALLEADDIQALIKNLME